MAELKLGASVAAQIPSPLRSSSAQGQEAGEQRRGRHSQLVEVRHEIGESVAPIEAVGEIQLRGRRPA